jgi:hypothetical protein
MRHEAVSGRRLSTTGVNPVAGFAVAVGWRLFVQVFTDAQAARFDTVPNGDVART